MENHRVIELRFSSLPRAAQEQLLYVLAADEDRRVRFTTDGHTTMATLEKVALTHPAFRAVSGYVAAADERAAAAAADTEGTTYHRFRPTEPSIPTTLRRARSRSRGRTPSPLRSASAPAAASPLRRGQARTSQWATRLVEDMLAAIVKGGGTIDRYTFSDVGDYMRHFLAARSGLASLVHESHRDILNAAAAYRRWCPACRLFQDCVERKIGLEELELVAAWRAALSSHITCESQKVIAGDKGGQVILRRYFALRDVADHAKRMFATGSVPSSLPRPVASAAKQALVGFVQAGAELQRPLQSRDDTGHRNGGRDVAVALEQAFDNPGFVDAIELLRVAAVAACDAKQQQQHHGGHDDSRHVPRQHTVRRVSQPAYVPPSTAADHRPLYGSNGRSAFDASPSKHHAVASPRPRTSAAAAATPSHGARASPSRQHQEQHLHRSAAAARRPEGEEPRSSYNIAASLSSVSPIAGYGGRGQGHRDPNASTEGPAPRQASPAPSGGHGIQWRGFREHETQPSTPTDTTPPRRSNPRAAPYQDPTVRVRLEDGESESAPAEEVSAGGGGPSRGPGLAAMYEQRLPRHQRPHEPPPQQQQRRGEVAAASSASLVVDGTDWMSNIAAAQRRLGALLDEADAVDFSADQLGQPGTAAAKTEEEEEEAWLLGKLQSELELGDDRQRDAAHPARSTYPERTTLLSPTPLERVAGANV